MDSCQKVVVAIDGDLIIASGVHSNLLSAGHFGGDGVEDLEAAVIDVRAAHAGVDDNVVAGPQHVLDSIGLDYRSTPW
jgi:hypothetical protein